MRSRFNVIFSYGYPIQNEESCILVKASNGEELVRFYGEEARELFSILTGAQGLFLKTKGVTSMEGKRKTSAEKAVEALEDIGFENIRNDILDMNDGEFKKTKDDFKYEKFDPVSGPAHYISGRKYEPRKVIMDWDLDFYLGNVVKYISRAGRKGDVIEDLKKAKQYLEWEIEMLEDYLK